MSILKHQIIQEKLLQQSLENSFTLIFHLNPITTKELTVLKKKLFKKNIRNSHQVLPLRFFHKLKLSEKKIIISSESNRFDEVDSVPEVKKGFLTNRMEPSWKHLGGSSCVFFCPTIKEVQDILSTIKGYPRLAESYLNVGMIFNKKSNLDGISDLTYLSSYDMETFLKTNASIYIEFLVLLNTNSIFHTVDKILLLNKHLLEANQFHLVKILSLYVEKLKTPTSFC